MGADEYVFLFQFSIRPRQLRHNIHRRITKTLHVDDVGKLLIWLLNHCQFAGRKPEKRSLRKHTGVGSTGQIITSHFQCTAPPVVDGIGPSIRHKHGGYGTGFYQFGGAAIHRCEHKPAEAEVGGWYSRKKNRHGFPFHVNIRHFFGRTRSHIHQRRIDRGNGGYQRNHVRAIRQGFSAHDKPAGFAHAGTLNVEKLKIRAVVTGGLKAHRPKLFGDPGRGFQLVERPGHAPLKMVVGEFIQIAFQVSFVDSRPVIGAIVGGFFLGNGDGRGQKKE